MRFPLLFILALALYFCACNKDRLEVKPNSSIVTLNTLEDAQNLLDNYQVTNTTAALPQISSDEYFFISDQAYNSLNRETQRNAYIWASDIYAGEVKEPSWNNLYAGVFYANCVLDIIDEKRFLNEDNILQKNLKGSALFIRAYNFHDLVKTFASVYDPATAAGNPGIPLRLRSGIDEIIPRSDVEASYRQIIKDLGAARALLTYERSVFYKNRPSLSAVYGLFARVYLDMGAYENAEKYADSCLAISSELIDYNTVSLTATNPFGETNTEVIYYTGQVNAYISGYTDYYQGYFGMDSLLIQMYHPDDLRLPLYYQLNTRGYYSIKRGYTRSLYAFTGLATDELYLIKAECAARRDDVPAAQTYLNELLVHRFRTGTYTPLSFSNGEDALTHVLRERRKELVWRGLRWQDLKRLNREGHNITLTRQVNGITYTLPPNDPRYVFPIPDDEIALSDIQQNIR